MACHNPRAISPLREDPMKHTARLACLVFASLAFAAHAAETASATVTITGGANAGTHTTSVDTAGCSTGLSGKNAFGVQISNPKDKAPNKPNSVQLDVPDK